MMPPTGGFRSAAGVSPPTTGGGGGLANLPPWAVALVATLVGLAAGWAAVGVSSVIPSGWSPVQAAALAMALVGAFLAALALVRWPALGLGALVLLVYLNLSDVLMRSFDVPSLLQLLTVVLLLAVLVEWREDVLEGLTPGAVTVALAAYVLAFLVSTTVAREPALADGRTAALVKGFVLYALVLLLATTPARVRVGVWALVGGGVALAGAGLLQVATGAFENDLGGLARVDVAQVYGTVMEPRLAGPLGDPNFFAQILVMVVPLALILAWKERTPWVRTLALGAAVMVGATVLFTYSRGGALALGAVVLCSIFAARPGARRVTVGAALVVAGLVLVPFSGDFARRMATVGQLLPGQEQVREIESSFQNRILQARVAGRMFTDRPALGVGAGNYTVHYYDYADEVGSAAPEYERAGGAHYPHNLYLELAAETGFLGLVTFGAALLLVFGHLQRAEAAYFAADRELSAALASALQLALVAYLLSALFLHGHYQRYLWILFGLSAALARNAPTSASRPTESGAASRGGVGRVAPAAGVGGGTP